MSHHTKLNVPTYIDSPTAPKNSEATDTNPLLFHFPICEQTFKKLGCKSLLLFSLSLLASDNDLGSSDATDLQKWITRTLFS